MASSCMPFCRYAPQPLMRQRESGVELNRLLVLLDGAVRLPRVEKNKRHVPIDDHRERIELQGSLCLLDGFVHPPVRRQIERIPVMNGGVTWVEFDGSFVFPLGSGPVAFGLQ